MLELRVVLTDGPQDKVRGSVRVRVRIGLLATGLRLMLGLELGLELGSDPYLWTRGCRGAGYRE